MSPEFYKKWAHILEDVEKRNLPFRFIKKLIIKLQGRKQQTVNIQKLVAQGFDAERVEEIVNQKLVELDDHIISVECVLDIESIAEEVQPETDKLLNGL